MSTKIVTTTEIKTRLMQSFNNVQSLQIIKTPTTATHSRTTTVINYKGIDLVIGVFTQDDPESETAQYVRCLWIKDKLYSF